MKVSKKIVIAGIVILALLILAVLVKKYFSDKAYVKVSPQLGDITESIYGLGKVKAHQTFQIKLGVVSTVQKIYVKEGDIVKKDQPLIKLDTGTLFKAPFDGTITLISVHEGETASPQVTLLRLENLKDRYIELSLEQEGILRVKKSQQTKVTFESMRGEVLSGTVHSIFPREDEFIANVYVNNLPENILPGMSADVAIEVGKVSGTLIPFKAVRNGAITVVRDGKTQKIKVEVGLIDGLSAEIKGGELKNTDEVLVPKE